MVRPPVVDVFVTPADREAAMREDVRRGLTARSKSLPPVWFYDERGSLLFDEITRLPEYYLTRSERAILGRHSEDIAAASSADGLVELGSGTSEKTRLLLDTMAARGDLRRIVLLDISEEVLAEAASRLSTDYGVEVRAVVGDFRTDLPKISGGGRQLWAFLGSTVGNFPPTERRRLFSEFRASMGPEDHLLLGTDLVKDPDRLVAAYDDSAGVTAAFNRNVLVVLNRELGADFDPDGFEHRAVWNAEHRWIEMRLRSLSAHTVHIAELELDVAFRDGEEILTEISAKFEPEGLRHELESVGLASAVTWKDPAGDFMLTLARAAA
jgi:dimethylhistidine N-methyltransferase